MALGKEVYYYQYPFFFPNSFLCHDSKYDLEIKIEFIQSISRMSRKKQFDIAKFMKKFSVLNKKKKEIKDIRINFFSELQDQGFIENKFELVYKDGSFKESKELNFRLLNKIR